MKVKQSFESSSTLLAQIQQGAPADYTPDIRDRVEIVRIPPDLNIVATYPIAALEDAKSPELAKKWVELVTSEEGQGVLQKWNFERAA